MSFNPSQIEAITHNQGPMMVLAGPGSGKTLVITHRTKYLIEKIGVNPSNILVITFTKAAAEEMKKRFLHLMGKSTTTVSFGTFHAIFFHILKYAYNYTAKNVLQEELKNQIFKEIVSKLDMEIDDENEFISSLSLEISMVKSELIDINNYYSINCPDDVFRSVYNQYEKRLIDLDLIDFDDMLVFCHQLLIERKDILSIWQSKYEYILIDEFQDINTIQYKIIQMLAAPRNNLFIVGDDDQSIYQFRGAKPDILLNFQNDYPNSKKTILSTNYRSTENIVQLSQRVIKNNKKRFEKEIITNNGQGNEVVIKGFKTPNEENDVIISEILRLNNTSKIPLSQIAVIYRTNVQPRLLIEKLMEYNISFKMRDKMPNIFEHWIAMDIMSYLRISQGENDRALFLRIINKPKRYIARNCFSEPIVSIDALKEYFSEQSWMVQRLDKLEYDLRVISRLKPYDAIGYIRKVINYEEYLSEYATFRKIKLDDLIEILDDIQESAKEHITFSEWFSHIENYTEELKKQSNNKDNDKDRVTLTTMHSAKGLEFKVVFVIDVNEDIIPHSKALGEDNIEEERRLFYVAMTRAKEYLNIYYISERYNQTMDVSRFIGEIQLPREQIKSDLLIEHKTMGVGTIKKVVDNKIEVYFHKTRELKVLDVNFCAKNNLIAIKNN